ncbi:hypothetical protein V5799_003046 [Amblyomma americanum]|uniref:Uncharacterized protein n=1 Tax=Amblyomma americanum TaxID=6943 RepID=A0AAQ4DA30_AMBAM
MVHAKCTLIRVHGKDGHHCTPRPYHVSPLTRSLRDALWLSEEVSALLRRRYFNCTHLNPSYERCSVPYSCCKANKSEAEKPPGADLTASLYCGRDVLNLSDHDAWYRVHMEGCTDAANRYIKENVMMLGGGCLVVVIVLSFIDMITNTVIDEIDSIRKFYDKVEEAMKKRKK